MPRQLSIAKRKERNKRIQRGIAKFYGHLRGNKPYRKQGARNWNKKSKCRVDYTHSSRRRALVLKQKF